MIVKVKFMKNLKTILVPVGTLLVITPFFINIYSVLRLISVIIGIILLTLGLTIDSKKYRIFKIILFLVIISAFVYLSDLCLVKGFKTIPVISEKIKSSSKMSVYNGILYRVYECDDVKTIDIGYKKEFVCNKNVLKKNSVNAFLANPKESYKKSKNKFVRLEGKITKMVGTSELTLNSYSSEVALNGYVEFDTDKSVVLEGLNIDPTNYYIYDNIEVIGKVTGFSSKDGILSVHLTNVIILNSGLYNDYELVVNDIENESKKKVEEGVYYIGLEGIYYKYDENNIYSMDYLLKDKRVKIEDLIKDNEGTKINEKDTLYELESYNIIICKNKDIIFASKQIEDLEEVCKKEA